MRALAALAALWLCAPVAPASGAASRFVLLVGLDGFRHDYLDLHAAPNLRAFRDRGSSAAALTPCFPSTTFPNFYSMVTGLLPAHHGIVEMKFWDPRRHDTFFYQDQADSADATWWGGTPAWVTAERAGLRSAILFWPGSAAPIQGVRPWRSSSYDPSVTREEKVRRVLDWFALPENERPRLAAVYFPEVDQAGHRHGPDSPQTREAVAAVDAAFGALIDGLSAVKPEVNVVVVSDHGMVPVEGRVELRAAAAGCQVTNNHTLVHAHCPDPRDVERLYKALDRGDRRYQVYRRRDLPRRLQYSANPRAGDLLLIPERPFLIELLPPGSASALPDVKGMHGYDPGRYPELGGILYAAGPSIRPRVRLAPARTIDVYPLLMRLLGLAPAPQVDGKLSRVGGLTR